MELINHLAIKTMIGGTDKGIDNIFDPNTPISETFYWDDGNYSREGFSFKFPSYVCITRVEVYATNRYPLGDVRLEIGDNTITKQNIVSRSMPLIYNGYINTNQLDIVRYTIQDSVISKILIYGYELKFLIKEDNKYYSINKENYNKETKTFNALDIINPTKDDIISLGFDNLRLMTTEINIDEETFKPLDKFNNFKIISMNNYNINIHGNKSNQELIIANNNISTRLSKRINCFKLKDSSNNIKIIFSIDNGITWKTYKDNEFKNLDIYDGFNNDLNKSIDIIKEHGIDSVVLPTIDFNILNIETIRFAYLLSSNNYMKELIWRFDSKGIMELCDKNEIKIQLYYGGVKLTSNIDAELLKTNITYEGINSI